MEGTCYCLDTFRAGDLEGAANVNVVTCSRLKYLVDGTDGLRYHASIPLYAHGRRLGVLNVASTDWRQLSADDLQLLATIGDLLGIAVERARLFAQSAQLGAVEERNRLARELHDTLAQGLAAIALHLESADALFDIGGDLAQAQASLRQGLKLTRASLDEARRSVLDLRAAPLENRTLAEALAVLATDTSQRSDLVVDFRSSGGNRPLPVRLEAGLYRIAQEGLNNVVQHAQATHAELELLTTPDEIRLKVEDNGKGFDAVAVKKQRFGLIGLNERAKLLGGQLSLQSTPGTGTRLEVAIPMAAPRGPESRETDEA
jgi:two-component system NarL family sensor kinase